MIVVALVASLGACPGRSNIRDGFDPVAASAEWRAFSARFITQDGRVVEPSQGSRTTSEGQAYARFHALVRGDREQFDRLLKWTEANLTEKGLTEQLPAWLWQKRDDETWGVADPNSASDADLWMAYALVEAGRNWGRNDYAEKGRKLAARISAEEMRTLEGIGPVVLPGKTGFVADDGTVRLNPSYWVIPIFRRFADEEIPGEWAAAAETAVMLIEATSPRGYTPDWIAFSQAKGGVISDPEKGAVGSYDAIRVYLFSAMVPATDPLARRLDRALSGLRGAVNTREQVPERVDCLTGALAGDPPLGFLAAAEGALTGTRDKGAREKVRGMAASKARYVTEAPVYYDGVLTLFGRGFAEGHFRFNEAGQLMMGIKGKQR